MPGWTPDSIIAEVQQRTENRTDGKMNLAMEFWLALDQLCNEQHFWWRKKRGQFTTVIGTQSYDLSLETPDFVELEQALLINADGVTVGARLQHITDSAQQLEMILNNVQNTPATCFIDVDTSLTTLVLNAPSNVAQKIVYEYWAIPMVTDTSTGKIPILPPWLHWGMIPALERRVYLVLYGIEDPRYETTDAEYQQFLAAANNTPSWSSKKVQQATVTRSTTRIVRAHGPGTGYRTR